MADNEWNLRDKVVLVTGATAGIGEATAHALAKMGARLLLHGRDEDRCKRVVADVTSQSGNPNIEYVLSDFASIESVRALATQVQGRISRLDVLINNAGAMFPTYAETGDGVERTVQVNHLAPFLLTTSLLDLLRASAPARVVTVASGAHRRETLDFDDLFMEGGYEARAAYARSKLMNVLFTRELARRLEGSGVTANSLSPGLVHTEFGVKDGMGADQQEVMNRGLPASMGARTSVYLASATEVGGVTGRYFSDSVPAEESEAARNEGDALRLWDMSARLVGLGSTGA